MSDLICECCIAWVRVGRRWHVQYSEPPKPLNVALCGRELSGPFDPEGWTSIPDVPVNACLKCAGILKERLDPETVG